MPVSRCPRCDAQVQIDERDLGYDVECPLCRAVFPARPDTAEPPTVHRAGDRFDRPRRDAPPRDDDEARPRRRRPRDDDDYDYRSPREVVDEARRLVLPPARFSVAACAVALVVHTVGLVAIAVNPQLLKQNPFNFGGPPPPPEVIIAIKIFTIVYVMIALAGALAMLRLRARPFAMMTMIMQLLPCLDYCCLVTLPLGIWGLVVLSRPEVRDGFELVARGRGGPTADDYDEGEER